MEANKRKRLEKAGFKVGSAKEFLGLTEAEARYVDLKAALSAALAEARDKHKLTQHGLALLIKSSQSRVAKMEAGDSSVSIDLLLRSLFAMGITPEEVASVVRRTQLRKPRSLRPQRSTRRRSSNLA